MKGKAPHPAPAAYLIHVTLECAFKVRILRIQGVNRTGDLRNRGMDEDTFERIFSGRTGHDLHQLANVAGLPRMLEAKGKVALLETEIWKSMSGKRPYSLRYGTEVISAPEAEANLKLAKELTSLILQEAA